MTTQSNSISSKFPELVVQKYGGTSVGTVDRIKQVAAHISNTVKAGYRVVAVVSAMGEQTDELLALAKQVSQSPPRRELDMLLTAGERISMALVTIALHDLGTRAVSLTGSQSGIITDMTHGNARISKILGQRIRNNLEDGSVVIVAGFQGVSQVTHEITTLGRGGSDLSAIALASHLQAKSCQLYKDVDGVFTADPRVVPVARKIDNLPWDTMTTMAWSGSSVVHARGAHLAEKFKMQVEIRNSFYLDRPGTFINGVKSMESISIEAISHRNGMVVMTGSGRNAGPQSLNAFRTAMWEQGESAQIQAYFLGSCTNDIRVTVPNNLVQLAKLKLQEGGIESIEASPECGIVTIVGSGFWQSPETIEKVQKHAQKIIFMDVKNNAISIGVAQNALEETLRELHRVLIETN